MAFNPKYGLRILSSDVEQDVYYCILLDEYGGIDFYGTIHKDCGDWQHSWPEHPLDDLGSLPKFAVEQIAEFMECLENDDIIYQYNTDFGV